MTFDVTQYLCEVIYESNNNLCFFSLVYILLYHNCSIIYLLSLMSLSNAVLSCIIICLLVATNFLIINKEQLNQ